MYMWHLSHFPLTHIDFLSYSASFPFFHPSFRSLGHFLLFTLHHSRRLLDSRVFTQNTTMTGCSSSHSSRKRGRMYERVREREKEKQAFTLVNVRVHAVDSIKEARRVRVDCRLLISGIFFFFFRLLQDRALEKH
jgi:hypothetical protein